MGGGIVVIIWAILLIPIGVSLGTFIFYVLIPFIYLLRKTQKEEQKFKRKFLLSILFTVIFVPSMCGFGIYLMVKDVNDYWKSQGAWDYWRMPLEEPYELVMIDTKDTASINIWENPESLVWGISKYERKGDVMYGEISRGPFHRDEPPKYFSFNLKTGQVDKIESLELFTKKLSVYDISEINLKSIRENWSEYWKNPRDD